MEEKRRLRLILGGARHYEQSFQTNAAAAALSVLTTRAQPLRLALQKSGDIPVHSVKLLLFAAAAVAITASGPAMARNWRQRQDSSAYSRCDLVRQWCAERHWKKAPYYACILKRRCAPR